MVTKVGNSVVEKINRCHLLDSDRLVVGCTTAKTTTATTTAAAAATTTTTTISVPSRLSHPLTKVAIHTLHCVSKLTTYP